MKGERLAKRSSIGSIMRRRLSDITNSQSQPKLGGLTEKHTQIFESKEDLMNQLLQEKAMMLKLIEERNKIIELSGNELRNLRMKYQKLQLQNWNLAQSNSQMLAELNLGREKLKALQHEVVCKEVLLKVKNSEPQRKADKKCQKTQNSVSQEGEKIEEECLPKAEKIEEECLLKAYNDFKPCNRSRRRPARSRSMGPSTTNRQISVEKEKAENKRRCVRRQSARFKSQEREPAENLFEIDDAKFPVTDHQPRDNPMKENDATMSSPSVRKEENCNPRNGTRVLQRSSLGRPLRRAVEKVQSYKEVPLNVKIRREE